MPIQIQILQEQQAMAQPIHWVATSAPLSMKMLTIASMNPSQRP
jgi:hypothetical protein